MVVMITRMKFYYLIIYLLLFAFHGRAQIISPQVIATSGDVFYTSFGSVSFTIGEPMIETFSNAGNIITQGFHQPFLNLHNNIFELISENDIVIYPNPANNNFSVSIKEFKNFSGEIFISDVLGRNVFRSKLSTQETKIQTHLTSGVYLAQINLSGQLYIQKLIINAQD